MTTTGTQRTASTFGAFAGPAGVEHGIGEVLQGNVASGGIVIASWPDSELFRILAGEPAMTVFPNLLITGVLAIFVSLLFLAWATMFVYRKHGGLVLVLLSVVMILVGGGFGPPILGVRVGAAATRINAPFTWWAHLSDGPQRLLVRLWSFAAGFLAWLLVMPGTIIPDRSDDVPTPDLVVPVLTFSALGLLLVTILAGFARDAGRRSGLLPGG